MQKVQTTLARIAGVTGSVLCVLGMISSPAFAQGDLSHDRASTAKARQAYQQAGRDIHNDLIHHRKPSAADNRAWHNAKNAYVRDMHEASYDRSHHRRRRRHHKR